jgi:DNA replication protein DnaC
MDVMFSNCSELTHSMQIAKATGNYKRRLKMLAKVTLLIIDDFGLKPLRCLRRLNIDPPGGCGQ